MVLRLRHNAGRGVSYLNTIVGGLDGGHGKSCVWLCVCQYKSYADHTDDSVYVISNGSDVFFSEFIVYIMCNLI